MAENDRVTVALEVPTDSTNRATVALVDAKVGIVAAKVDGVAELVKSENAATQAMLADLKPLPVAVARLEADLRALDAREQEADTEMSRRVSGVADEMDRRLSVIENARERVVTWKVTALVSVAAAVAGGAMAHIHIP